MTWRKSFVTLFLFTLCASVGHAQTPSSTPQREAGFLRRSVTLRLTTIDFRVYIPAGYDPAKKYPVILYLHGRGPRGNDNEKQIGGAHLGSVIQLFDMKHPERYRSFIAVFPQTQSNWVGEPAEQAIKALDQTVAEFNGDAQRIYLTGASLGGYGSWYLAAKYPKKFAAVVPLSGGIVPPINVQRIQPLAELKLLMPAEMFAFTRRRTHTPPSLKQSAKHLSGFSTAGRTILLMSMNRERWRRR